MGRPIGAQREAQLIARLHVLTVAAALDPIAAFDEEADRGGALATRCLLCFSRHERQQHGGGRGEKTRSDWQRTDATRATREQPGVQARQRFQAARPAHEGLRLCAQRLALTAAAGALCHVPVWSPSGAKKARPAQEFRRRHQTGTQPASPQRR
jgi:hypothetical protein